jgi:hypothetical protein
MIKNNDKHTPQLRQDMTTLFSPELDITEENRNALFNQLDDVGTADDNKITSIFAVPYLIDLYKDKLSEEEIKGLNVYGQSLIQKNNGEKTDGMDKAEFNKLIDKIEVQANDKNDSWGYKPT